MACLPTLWACSHSKKWTIVYRHCVSNFQGKLIKNETSASRRYNNEVEIPSRCSNMINCCLLSNSSACYCVWREQARTSSKFKSHDWWRYDIISGFHFAILANFHNTLRQRESNVCCGIVPNLLHPCLNRPDFHPVGVTKLACPSRT